MTALRVIPCLDVAAGRVVKGVNFLELRDSGDPVELARRYFREGADEITFLDVSATVEGRRAILDIVENCAEELFIPLTVGGGITKVEDVSDLLSAGADKVSLGSAGVLRPELFAEIAEKHGSQVLVASLDIKRFDKPSGFGVTIRGGRELTDWDVVDWVREVQARGAGEILANSIDTDGTKNGFDVELLELLRGETSLPIIASGGAGRTEHFIEAAKSGANALLAASIFHNEEVSISEVKQGLASSGFEVRW